MMLKYFSLMLLLKLCNANLPNLGNQCNITKIGLQGACILVDDCPVPPVYSLSLAHVCDSNNSNDIVVCCAGATVKNFKSQSLLKCQEYSKNFDCDMQPLSDTPLTENRLISIKDFPHIANILYHDLETNLLEYYYDQGSLISSRFVLCTASSIIYTGKSPVKVELGTLDRAEYADRENHLHYGVAETIVHPSYEIPRIYHDIALIRLSRKVKFSHDVRPICLPDIEIMPKVVFRINFEKQGIMDPLVKYQRRPVPIDICRAVYSFYKIPRGINENFICTTPKELGDTEYHIRIDGAPITIDHPSVACSRVLLGVSVATKVNTPAAAAINVYKYREWIEDIIWANGVDN